MFPMSIVLEEDFIPELKRRLKALHDLGETDVGWFSDSGIHDSSGWNYPTLARYHAVGNPQKSTPPRPVLSISYAFTPLDKSPLKKSIHKYLSGLGSRKPPVSAKWVAKQYATFYVDKTKMLFGDTSKLRPNSPVTVEMKQDAGVSPAQNPLVWTGSLRDNLTYSINGTVV